MSTRQSARIKAKNIGANVSAADTSAALLSDEEYSEPKTKASARKRKPTAGSSTLDVSRPAKRSRTRGFLERVLDMPFDLLPEIFGHLHPLDLLNLSRTSKDLRKFFMSRSAKSIWLQTMANAPEMVDCPSHIDEPAWVNILFGTGCMQCGKNRQGVHYIDRAILRLCTKCIKESFTAVKNLSAFTRTRVYPTRVAVHNVIHSLSGGSVWYLEPTRDEKWTKEYQQLTTDKAKAEWETRIISEQTAEAELGIKCQQMRYKLRLREDIEKRALVEDRRKQIIQHIKKMGWSEEIDKMGGNLRKLHIPLINDACQKNITTRILTNMEPRLKLVMEAIKVERLARELHACLKQRMQTFAIKTAESIALLPRGEPHPGLRDVFESQRVKDLVFKTSSDVQLKADNFNFISEILPEIAQQWRERAASEMVNKIRATMGENHVMDPSTVLSLATSVFSCLGFSCSERNMWFEDALAHPCCTPRCSELDLGMNTEPAYLFFTKKPWTANVHFSKAEHNIISEVVQLCGLDPLTATVDQMNQLDPVFECAVCRRPDAGRQVMSWQGVSYHLRIHHAYTRFDTPDELILLEGDEAQDAKKRIAEAREKKIHKSGLEIVCMHCPFSGKMAATRKHLMKEHDIPKPTEKTDFILSGKNPNSHQTYPVEMWPPYVSLDTDDDDDDEESYSEEEGLEQGCHCGQCYAYDDDDDEYDSESSDESSAGFYYF